MDSPIYRLLSRAEQEKNVFYLKEAYNQLDPDVTQDKDKSAKDIENFSQSLYVECAEKAINFNEHQIANRCIQIYFSLPMISNQFLARAYLCQFELLAPKSTSEIENLAKSIPFLFKAIEFSTKNKRYNFLIYNSSLIFWKYARSFIKENFKRHLCTPLKKITQALKDIDDADYEWRSFLERTLIEAYIDNKQITEANNLAGELLKFIENYLPNQFDEFFEFLINKSLIDDEELRKISMSKWDLEVIFRIEKLKRPKELKKTKKNSKSDDIGNDENILKELNDLYKILIPKKRTVYDKRKSEFMTTGSFEQKEDSSTVLKRQKLLLSLSHLCLSFEEVNISSRIIGYLKENENLSEDYLFEIELIECEQSIKKLKHKQERLNKNIVKIRTESINKCHETLRNILRTQNFRLIQLGCLKLWSFCLPLLQPGLRLNVRKPLQFAAECLDSIDSMEWLLRCQIHFELAKCDEEIEQLQTAEQHYIKAIQFDDEKVYSEQLEHALKRLRLRAELYFTPERVEDQVAMILEQCVIGGRSKEKVLKPAISELLESLNAKKSDNSKSEINTRSLLLRAGDLLAPNQFTHVLESETFKANFGKLNEDQVTKLCKKSINFDNCVKKGQDHLTERISDFVRIYKRNNPDASEQNPELESNLKADYKERLKLWFDLSKIARKQQIWDICRVSSRFCLLYDSDQLITRFLKDSGKFNSLYDIELMRNLAEAHFIFAESLVQYIRGEGIELYEKPNVPEIPEPAIKPKLIDETTEQKLSLQIRDFDTDKEWKEYCDWLSKLCKEAVDHFLKGIQIGVELKESWLVCQGSAYLWNYFHHIVEKKKNNQILPVLSEIFDAIKKVGHDTEAELLVTISVALSTGLMQSWLPNDQIRSLQIPSSSDFSSFNDKRKQAPIATSKPINIPPEGATDFKKALDVCDYAMNVTSGDDMKDVINLKDRSSLIKNWVLAKQFCQSPIKNYGLSKSIEKVQDKYTKCMVGVEILNRNVKVYGQNLYEIKEAPSIKELIGLIDTAHAWPDKLIELELWSNLCVLANKAMQTENLRYCHSKALESVSYFEKRKTENKKIYTKSQFLLSEACIALGEHLAFLLSNPNMTSSSNSKSNTDHNQNSAISNVSNKDIRVTLRRNALNAFADAAYYSSNAEYYEYVVHAARHYWNLCLPYLVQPQERATLYENINEILTSWTAAYKYKSNEESVIIPESPKVDKDPEPEKTTKAKVTKATSKKEETTKLETQIDSEPQKLEKKDLDLDDAYDELTLRCVLYACLFQISIDKNQYEEALEQMETALNDLPRTKHRLLVYRFKVITKSKLGLDVQMDLQKFREESEKNLAQMYRKVALSSIRHTDTINSYQRAIETLSSDENIWLKFEYIVELAQFMYSNEYKLENCLELMEWAAELIMFKIKVEKVSRQASAVTKPQSKGRTTNKAQSSMSIMPTIQDDVEIKSFHKKMDKKSEDEYDQISRTKENLFEESFIELNQSLTWSNFQDIKQLEGIIRSNVILAKMSGQSHKDFTGYLLKAYYSVNRLINLAIENANVASKEIQKLNVQTEVVDNKKKTVAQVDVKKQNETKTKKNKNETNINSIPQNQEQWSQFELNEEISTAWSHELMIKSGINKHTISEPYLAIYYLEILGDMLKQQGWSHLLFPIYYLQLFIINSAFILENNSQNISLNIYVRLKMINLCIELNLIQSILSHQQALALLILNAKGANVDLGTISTSMPSPKILLKLIQIDALEACLSRDEICAFKQRMTQLEDEENNLKGSSRDSFSSSKKDDYSANPLMSSKNKLKRKQLTAIKTQNNVKLSADSSNDFGKNSDTFKRFDSNDIKLPGERKKVANNFHEILYKDVWILLAELLLENGFFQIARDYLYESLNASITFEDQNSIAKCEYLLGKIALYDCNFIEARNYALNAQVTTLYFIRFRKFLNSLNKKKSAIDETFWCKSIRLLVDSHRYDYNDKEGYEKSIKILNKSIDLINQEKRLRTNKLSNLNYIEALLLFDLAEVTYEGIINGKLSDEDLARRHRMSKRNSRRNSMHPSMFKRFSFVCNTYQTCFEIFMKNGYKREAVNCLKTNSKLLKMFGDDCVNMEAKKDYYLQTLSSLNNAKEIMNDILNEAISLQSPGENVSLPIQRELTELKLEICKLMTDMLEIYLNEIIVANEKNSNKNNMTKVVELFTGTTDLNLNEIETEWKNNLALIPDFLIVNLISCHQMSLKVKNLKCKSLYLIGRTCRLVTDIKYQLRKANLNDINSTTLSVLNTYSCVSKWDNFILELIKNSQTPTSDSESSSKSKSKSIRSNTAVPGANPDSSLNDISEESANGNINILSDRGDYNMNFVDELNLNNIIEQETLKNLLISINQSEAQAIECQLQALNLAFIVEDKELGRKITYELIELIGKFDLNLCSQLISIYQSYSSAIEAENIILKSSLNPKNSLLTGFYSLLKYYQKENIKNNLLNSPIIKQVLDLTKTKFNATKYLTIDSNHFNYSKEFPTNYTFLVLQHNEKKNELFASILDRSKAGSIQKISKPQILSFSQTKAAVIKVKTDPFELNYLLQQWKEWKTTLQSFNLKLEFQLNNDLIKKQTFSNQTIDNLNDLLKYYLDPSSAKYDEMLQGLNDLENKFEFLINSTEMYLRKVSDFVQNYFLNNFQEQINTKQNNQTNKPTEKLIILADTDLLELPLESLKVFYDNQNLCSISRDFSLQFFSTRFFAPKETTEPVKDDKKKDKASKPNPKITIAPPQNLEPLPDYACPIEMAQVKYLIDVFNEASTGLPNELTPIGSFKKITQQFSSICSKWSGLTGLDHSPSLGECESFLKDSSCLLFNGMERFLSYFSSNKIASQNLNLCRLIIANDLAQTSKSFTRLGKDDVLRNTIELECENYLEMNILLSLTGVRCIMSNQWTTTVVDNSIKFQSIIREMMENRQSCGEALRYKISPHLKYLLQIQEEDRKPVANEKEKDKKEQPKKIDKKESKATSAKKQDIEPQMENINESENNLEKEAKRQEKLRNLAILRKENLNMVCYGLPDVYLNIF